MNVKLVFLIDGKPVTKIVQDMGRRTTVTKTLTATSQAELDRLKALGWSEQ